MSTVLHFIQILVINARTRLLMVSCLMLIANGCALTQQTVDVDTDSLGDPGVSTARSSLVARDLVNALVQIPSLNPAETRLIFAKPQSSYGKVLAKELQRAGYDMRIGNNPTAKNYLAYTIASTGSENGSEYEFTVSVGSTKVRREYALEGSRIYPVSSLYVFGPVTQDIALNDDIFSTQDVAVKQDWTGQDYVAKPKTSSQRPPISVVDKKNMYEIGRSNFAHLTQEYENVEQSIIVFPNDSVVLGRFNKQLTRELANVFKPATDLISVIGCSHGSTNIAEGNRKLAEGRTARVKEELVRFGINAGYVLDEGCWSKEHFDEVMPRRGVVLTLKRLREAG